MADAPAPRPEPPTPALLLALIRPYVDARELRCVAASLALWHELRADARGDADDFAARAFWRGQLAALAESPASPVVILGDAPRAQGFAARVPYDYEPDVDGIPASETGADR